MALLQINIQVTGFFREVIGKSKFCIEVDTDKTRISVYSVLDQLCEEYGDPLRKLLYLEDGSIDDWIRVMINGRDIRFLDKEARTLDESDKLLIMSISAGG